VAHTCNPCQSVDRGIEDLDSRSAQAKKFRRPQKGSINNNIKVQGGLDMNTRLYLKKNQTKMTGSMAPA
jgi:hypothetical protein